MQVQTTKTGTQIDLTYEETNLLTMVLDNLNDEFMEGDRDTDSRVFALSESLFNKIRDALPLGSLTPNSTSSLSLGNYILDSLGSLG